MRRFTASAQPRVALFGAGVVDGQKNLGYLVAERLIEAGVGVRCLQRPQQRGAGMGVGRGSSASASPPRLPPGAEEHLGDATNPADVAAACEGATVAVSTLTPPPTAPGFADSLVRMTGCVVDGARRTLVDGAAYGGSGKRRIVLTGGAGVMRRSDGAFVTDTLPGSVIKMLLPIYDAFFVAHKR